MQNHEENVLNEDFRLSERKSALLELKNTAPGKDGIYSRWKATFRKKLSKLY